MTDREVHWSEAEAERIVRDHGSTDCSGGLATASFCKGAPNQKLCDGCQVLADDIARALRKAQRSDREAEAKAKDQPKFRLTIRLIINNRGGRSEEDERQIVEVNGLVADVLGSAKPLDLARALFEVEQAFNSSPTPHRVHIHLEEQV